jgi:hypothetical protein
MVRGRLVLHIPFERLLVILLITVVPICAVGLFTMTRAELAMDRTIGAHFKTLAEATAAGVSNYIHERVQAAGTLAADPLLVEAALGSNRSYAGASEAAIGARIQKMENEWNTPAAEGRLRAMLTSKASRMLARYRELDRRYLRLTLTDARGVVVAATHKTPDYYQADEDFWQAVYANGRGAVHLTDILYDGVTKSYYVGIGVPVTADGANTFVGALAALVEVSSLFPLVNREGLGGSWRAMLVKADGTVIISPAGGLSAGIRSEEYLSSRENFTTVSDRRRGYAVITLRGGEQVLVGYVSTGLRESYPNLDWHVVVAQDTREALAATRGVMRLIFFSASVGLAMLTLMLVYFLLHRRRDYIDLGSPVEKEAVGVS